MPSHLVRTYDMKVVSSSQVNEGYCALYYSWNQSGGIIENGITIGGNKGKDGKRRIDQAKHRIILPPKSIQRKPRGRKRTPSKLRYVQFKDIIQQICRDFNINFIWYDQMCIDQVDEEKKCHEIQQMHKIYSNAYCMVGLVHELHYTYSNSYEYGFGQVLKSQWFKRMWTLQEVLLSK